MTALCCYLSCNFLATNWSLDYILFCKPFYILENKLSVCLSVWPHLISYWLYSMSMTLLDHWPIKILGLVVTFFLQWIIFLYCINQTLRMDKNYFHDYFLHFCWVIIIRQWCSSNHNSSAHDFVSKLPNILINRHTVGHWEILNMLLLNNKAH